MNLVHVNVHTIRIRLTLMCMFLCVQMYIWVNIYILIYKHIYVHLFKYLNIDNVFIGPYKGILTCMSVQLLVRIFTFICMCIHILLRMHVYIFTYQ